MVREGKKVVRQCFWRGSYTVEAAWILSISLSLMMAAMLLGFSLYRETLKSVSLENDMAAISAVSLFRKKDMLEALWGLLTNE